MEEKAKTDLDFIFGLNSDFVNDYKERNPEIVIENESLKKAEFFQLLAKEILKEIKTLNIIEIADMPFTIRACLAFCDFELNKNRNIYNKAGKKVPRLSYDN